MTAYLVCGSRPWSRQAFDEVLAGRDGWHFHAYSETPWQPALAERPRYVFFLHWSWKVPLDFTKQFECVQFHMTDLPFGRGGSPLQNLILHGYRDTKLTAFRMTDELDAGPVYMKRDLPLDGSAEEVYLRSERLACEMALEIAATEPEPVSQDELPWTVWKRRTPEQSEIPACWSLDELHDYVRMLDADGYPAAFIVHDGFRYEFRRSSLRTGHIDADVKITRV